MSPTQLITRKLGVTEGEIVHIDEVAPESRNKIWRGEIEGWEQGVYLKVQGGERFSRSVAEEAEVLEMLRASSFSQVPRLLAHGTIGAGTSYLLCEECAGCPLQDHLARIGSSVLDSLFEQVLNWLHRLQDSDRLRRVLEGRSYLGVYQKDFDPVEHAYQLCSKLKGRLDDASQRKMSALLERSSAGQVPPTHADVVHGSLTPFNLLVDRSGTSSDPDTLTGVLDFEATRLGSLAYDLANMAFCLLVRNRPVIAKQWLSACNEQFGTRRIVAQAVPFLVHFYLMRRKNEVGGLPPADEFITFLMRVT